MLYITTRNDDFAFPDSQVLNTDTAPDGGYFLPFSLPTFTREQIISLQHKSYGGIVADILNRFFSTQLTGWDVDLCIGRNTARIAAVGNKIYIAEMWHNPEGALEFATNSLYRRVAGTNTREETTQWFRIAAQIAYLFGLYTDLCRSGECAGGACVDLSVSATDMCLPIAALYAKSMGLPIGNIIITSIKSNVLWDLVHRGETNVSASEDSLIAAIERLIYHRLGYAAVNRYVAAVNQKRTFFIEDERISDMSNSLFCVVVSQNRTHQIMGSFHKTNHYILEPISALCISGLQDYRAKTGENNRTLVVADTTPATHMEIVTAATGLDEQAIMEKINRP